MYIYIYNICTIKQCFIINVKLLKVSFFTSVKSLIKWVNKT